MTKTPDLITVAQSLLWLLQRERDLAPATYQAGLAAIDGEREMRRACADILRDVLATGDRLKASLGLDDKDWHGGALAARQQIADLLALLERTDDA